MKDQKTTFPEDGKFSGLIDVGSEFKGDLSFKGTFRIEGNYKGTIASDALLIIGERGKVEADIKVGQVVINGEFRGKIIAAERVEIHDRGRVFGSIVAPKLVVEEGAYLEATCQTSGAPAPEAAIKAAKPATL